MAGLKWIPINLIQTVLENRLATTFQVYIILNIETNGFAVMDKSLILTLRSRIGVKSEKTINAHLKKLRQLNWLGFDENVYYIRSIKTIGRNLKGRNTSHLVEFHSDYINNWIGYLCGAFIGYLAYIQRQKKFVEALNASGFNKRDNPYRNAKASTSFPVSNKSIEKILGVSMGTASKFKRVAREARSVSITHDFVKANIEYKDWLIAKKEIPELKSCVVLKGIVYHRKPDRVSFLLKYRSGKKMKYNRRDYKGRIGNRFIKGKHEEVCRNR